MTREDPSDVAVENRLINELDALYYGETADKRTAQDEELGADIEATDDKKEAREQWRKRGDDELTILVRDNADVEVICPWMDNGVVTLSVAMYNYDWPPYTTLADEPFLIAIVNDLLANRPIKPEEPEKEEANTEELLAEQKDKKSSQEEKAPPTKESHHKDQKAKTEINKSQAKSKTASTPPLLEKRIDTPQALKASVVGEEKPQEHTNEVGKTTVKVIADSAHNKLVQPTQSPVAVKISVTKSTPETTMPATPDYQMDTSDPIDFGEEDILISHIKEVGRQLPGTIEGGADREKTPAPESNGELHVSRQEDADLELQVQADMLDLSKTSRLPEPIKEDEQVILSEEGVALATSIVEKLVDHSYGESETAGISDQSSLMPEEIESPLIQLAERIRVSDSQIVEIANENLDKIIETIAKIELPSEGDIVVEAEVQGRLEELFTELFDTMNIDYSPELITSLVHQTLKWYLLADEIEKLKDEEELEEIPLCSNVIIKRLIAALKAIKRATGHAYAIGKAALMLCSFNFQPKLHESF